MECRNCNGTGREEPNCPRCSGYGWVDDLDDGGTMTCPECKGLECAECEGSGEEQS